MAASKFTAAERWQQVKEVLGRALEIEPSKRSAYLDEASAGDAELRAEVERLLAVDDSARDLLGTVATQASPGVAATAATNSRVGLRVGPYKIVETIGHGGMGTVYRAVRDDDQYQKKVAVKLIQAGYDSAFVVSRFKNERQILASLDHPNIAHLLDGGTTEDRTPYFVMELIEGQPIDEYCRRQKLSIQERLRLFLQVCAAVQFAHQRLIIHRDIKPGNILVGADGVPKLLDFGIAKILDKENETGPAATVTMYRALTPAYASPEQVKGDPITTASDVYSLGVVLYELLTERHPYCRPNTGPEETARAACETEPEKPSTVARRAGAANLTKTGEASGKQDNKAAREKLARQLKGDLDNITLMALRKEPQRRYASVERFAEDIRRHLENLPVLAREDTARYRVSKFVARHKAGVAAAALVAATLILALIVTLREAHIARVQAAIAQQERARAQRRFDDVHKLSKSLIFEVHDSIRDLPGSTPARKLIMDRAVEYLDSLAKDAGGDSSLLRDLAEAYHRVGLVQGNPSEGNVGDTNAMFASLGKSAAIFEQLAKANPTVALDQLNAALANRMLGSIADGPEERLEHLHKALGITEGLLKTNPADPKVKSERSLEFASLGGQQDQNGDTAGALESLRQSLALREALLASNPEYPRVKQGLAMNKVQLANVMAETGARKEALEMNAAGIALYESVVAEDKNNARAQRELASSFGFRARFELSDGRSAEALASFRQGLAILEPLEKRDPENTMLKVDVGGFTEGIGIALLNNGAQSQGLETLDRGIALLEKQLTADPFNAPRTQASGYTWKGDAFLKTGKAAEAIASDRKAVSILESGDGPPDQSGLCNLAAVYVKLGAALQAAGNASEADAAYRKALKLVEPKQNGETPNLRTLYVIADADYGMGDLAKKAAQRLPANAAERVSKISEARDWYKKSADAWQQIPEPAYLNPEGFRCGSPAQTAAALAGIRPQDLFNAAKSR